MKKGFILHAIFICFLSSCMRTTLDPMPAFDHVREDMSSRTGYTIYWDNALSSELDTCLEDVLNHDLTVEDAVYVALLNNRDLQAVYENLGIAKAQLVQAGLLKNPIFSLAYRFPTQPVSYDLVNLDLMQNFLETLLIPIKKKMAAAELEETKYRVANQVLQLIAQTKAEFYRLQALEQMWDLQNQILFDKKLSYQAAKKLFAAGNIKELELVDKQEMYEQMKIEIANLEVEIINSREKMNVHMGLWGDQINWQIVPNLSLPPIFDKAFDDIENVAIENSLPLKIVRIDLYKTAAKYGIDTAKLVFRRIDVGASAEEETGTWYVGPALKIGIPLFDQGEAISAAARFDILKRWNKYTALAIKTRAAARAIRVQLLNAKRKILYQQQVIVPLAEQKTYLTLLQQNAMQMGVFDLLDVKRSELQKKVQLVKSLRDSWMAYIALEALLNGYLIDQRMFETSRGEPTNGWERDVKEGRDENKMLFKQSNRRDMENDSEIFQ